MDAQRLRTGALSGALQSFSRPVFRVRSTDRPNPLDATGSLLEGGRYNPPGLFSVLYCSLDPWIAHLEFLDHQETGSANVISFTFPVALTRVLNLRNPALLEALVISTDRPLVLEDLTVEDRLPLAFGTIAQTMQLDGLVVPSAAWGRHEDDLPVIVGLPAGIARPSSDSGNLVILDTTVISRQAVREIYRGLVRLDPSPIGDQAAVLDP